MARRAYIRCTPRLLGILLLGVFAACDNTVDLTAENDDLLFAVYGFLDSAADTQFVRVEPVRAAADAGPVPLAAEVTSREEATGVRTVWQDSLVQLDDGSTGTLYFALLRVHPGERHRLVVQRPDGAAMRAVTQVPPAVPLAVEAVTTEGAARDVQRVTWEGLTRRPHRVSMHYEVAPPEGEDTVVVAIPYEQRGDPVPGGWQFTVLLSRDRETVLRQLDRSGQDSSLVLVRLRMAIDLRSDEWPPTMTPDNVERGTGFFGAVGRIDASWTLDAAATVRIGFTPPVEDP